MHLYLITTLAFSESRFMWEPTPLEISLLVANYVCCIPVVVAVGLFSLYHFWNLSANVSSTPRSFLFMLTLRKTDHNYRGLGARSRP